MTLMGEGPWSKDCWMPVVSAPEGFPDGEGVPSVEHAANANKQRTEYFIPVLYTGFGVIISAS
jgi:hypothetical protein